MKDSSADTTSAGHRPARVNLKAVADLAGVSKATASLALRHDPSVHASTREKVRKAASRLGYIHSAIVSETMSRFRKGREVFQGSMALVNLHHYDRWLDSFPTFRHWIKGCDGRASELGYRLERFWLHDPGMPHERLADILEAQGFTGVLFGGVETHGRLPGTARPLWERFPCVVIGVRPEVPELHCVLHDHYASVRHAVRKLHGSGARRAGLAVWKDLNNMLELRYEAGFLSGARALDGLETVPPFFFESLDPAPFLSWIRKHRPDSILAIDPIVLQWMAGLGGPSPRVALLDLPDPEFGEGIWQQNDEVGRLAVELLASMAHRREKGLPRTAMALMVEGVWKDAN